MLDLVNLGEFNVFNICYECKLIFYLKDRFLLFKKDCLKSLKARLVPHAQTMFPYLVLNPL
jgi:hypothetical protein